MNRRFLFPLLIALALCSCSSPQEKEAKFFGDGMRRFNEGKYAEAVGDFKDVLKINPKNDKAHYHLALSYLKIDGNEGAAAEHFEKTLSLNPDAFEALVELTKLRIQEGKTDQAIKRVQEQISRSPKNPRYYNLLGHVYEFTNDPAGAESAYRKSIEVEPNALVSYLDLGRLYVNRKKFQEAIEEFEKVRKARPDYAPASMILGVIYDTQRETEKAIKEYEEALKASPRFGPAANNLAWVLAESGGEIDRALALAETAQAQLPDEPRVSDTLGWIYFKKSAYPRAISHLKESVEKLPNQALPRYHLGMTYMMNGEKDLAKKELTQALSLSPDFPGADQAREALKKLS
jgi:Flp pilus assembly protein TadD